MDLVNTKINQGIARESVSILNEKTFSASNMIGLNSGASMFTKSENAALTQQVKSTEKPLVNLSEQQVSDNHKNLKVNRQNADIKQREENASFSKSLGSISEFLQTNGTKISFSIEMDANNKAKTPVVVVSDTESGNLIRQIPTEEMQLFAERIRELESDLTSTTGLMLDSQA